MYAIPEQARIQDALCVMFLASCHMYPIVNKEKCKGCGNCVEICPSEVYEMGEDNSGPVRLQDCIECWACVNQCPTESIRLEED